MVDLNLMIVHDDNVENDNNNFDDVDVDDDFFYLYSWIWIFRLIKTLILPI